jgi:hypothetical protein
MKRAGAVLFLVAALIAAPAAAKPAKRGGGHKAPASATGTRTKTSTSTSTSTRTGDADQSSSSSASQPAETTVAATTTTTTATNGNKLKTKTYTFGAMDVEGKLKTPQLLYFLNRVKLELDMSAPDKRSFMKELEQSADDKNL